MVPVDEGLVGRGVSPGIQQSAFGRVAVAPRSSRFLIIGFDAAGHVEVDDEPDVGLVDAHAEGVGGHDDRELAEGEPPLHGGTLLPGHAGVVPGGPHPVGVQHFGQVLHPEAGPHIDDAAFTVVLPKIAQQPLLAVVDAGGVDHTEPEVGAVDGGDHLRGVFDAQALKDVVPHPRVRRRGESQGAGKAETLTRRAEREVVGPKVVAPLGYAVGLVDGQEVDAGPAQPRDEAVVGEALGSDVEDVEITVHEVEVAAVLLRLVQMGVDRRRADAVGLQRFHLVVHQGDEGRDDDGPADDEGGEDVAHALATAGGHHHKGVSAGQASQCFRLSSVKVAVPESLEEERLVDTEVTGECIQGYPRAFHEKHIRHRRHPAGG